MVVVVGAETMQMVPGICGIFRAGFEIANEEYVVGKIRVCANVRVCVYVVPQQKVKENNKNAQTHRDTQRHTHVRMEDEHSKTKKGGKTKRTE